MMTVRCACVIGLLGLKAVTTSFALKIKSDRSDRQAYPSFSNSQLTDSYNSDLNDINGLTSDGVNINDINKFLTQQQQYAGYYDDVPGAYYNQDLSGSSTNVNDISSTSPALSALALLGFLYFLNLIQNVLNNTNGRRRRRDIADNDNDLPMIDPDINPADQMDSRTRVAKFMDYLEDFFIQLPFTLGMREKPEAIDRGGREDPITENNKGFMNMVSSRLGMISSIMDFLKDPRPSRVKRDSLDQVSDQNPGFWQTVLQRTSELTESVTASFREVVKDVDAKSIMLFLRAMLEPSASSEVTSDHSRVKRFTDRMNSWYDTLAGHNAESAESVVQGRHSYHKQGDRVMGFLGNILRSMSSGKSNQT